MRFQVSATRHDPPPWTRRHIVLAALAITVFMLAVPSFSHAQEATVEGRVLDLRTRAPVAGATVVLPQFGTTQSGSDGRFQFSSVAPGRYQLEVTHLGYAPLSRPVTVPETGNVDLEISLSVRAIELGELLVVGRRRGASPAATGPTAVLTRSDFETLPDNKVLGDVVNRLPGVFMRGPVGVNRDIKLRGMDKGFNRFVVDGVQLPGLGSERTFRPSRLSPFFAQSVRVLRNTGAEFESDGIAGRIAVDGRPPPATDELEVRSFVGGIDDLGGESRQLDIGLRQRLSESLSYNLFGHVGRQPREKVKTKETTDESGDFVSFEREDEQVGDDQFNLQGDLAWTREATELSLRPIWLVSSASKTKTKLIDKGPGDARLEDETEEASTETQGATLAVTRDLTSRLEWTSNFSFHRSEEETSKSKDKSRDRGSGFQPDRRENEEITVENEAWQGNIRLNASIGNVIDHTLSVGGQFRVREFETDKMKERISPDGSVRDETGPADAFVFDERYLAVFVQDELALTNGLSVVPGVRAEWVRSEGMASDGQVRASDVVDVNPSLNARWEFGGPLSLEAAVSRKLARPKFDDLVPFVAERGRRFVEGNPDLDPARSWNFDVGARFERSGLNLSLFLFHKEVDDLIGEVPTGEQRDGKDVNQPMNVGDGWIQGIELEQRFGLRGIHPLLGGLTFWANESLFRSEVDDQALGLSRPFDEQRDAIVNSGIDWITPLGLTVTFAGKYLGGLEKVKGVDEVEIEEDRFLLDVGLRQSLEGGSVEFLFDIVNLFDPAQDKTLLKGSNRTLDSETPGTRILFGLRSRF